jgi:hypothetical protein
MAFSLVATVSKQSTDTNPITTSSIDTTGADLIILLGCWATVYGGAGTFSDSKGNTWTLLTQRTYSTNIVARLAYCVSPTVGSGHTFSFGAGNFGYYSISVQAWSGVNTSSAFGSENGYTGNIYPNYTFQPGSLTPAEDNELLVAGFCHGRTMSYTIGSSYTETADLTVTNGRGLGFAYLVQGTAATVNPVITVTDNLTDIAAVTACFKAAAAATGQPTTRRRGGIPFSGGRGPAHGGNGGGRMWGRTRSGLVVPRRFEEAA